MYTDAKLETIQQTLQLARERQKLDPQNTTETLIYIAHVQHLLIELERALFTNQLQARNIRLYIDLAQRNAFAHIRPAPIAENTEVAHP